MADDDPRLRHLAALGRFAAEGDVPDDVDARGRDRLVETIARRGRTRSPRPLRRRVAAIAAAAAIAALFSIYWISRPIGYVVDHAHTVAEGGYVRAAPDRDSTLAFSDGSTLVLGEGASARLAEVDRHGARVTIEDGRARCSVHSRPGASWRVDAGPYSVAVHGTVFDVAWSSREGVLDVVMHEGVVTVTGPRAEGGVALSAGYRLRARVGGDAPEIARADEPPIVAATLDEALSARPVEPAAPPASSSSAQAVPEPVARPSWSKRVAAGDFAAVLAEAEERGIDTTLGAASLDDVAAFADASRYGRRRDLSRRAEEAIRSRFPASSRARTSAFLLGSMADDGGGTAAAIGWYDLYLTEAPSGPFASEALGRKMLAVRRARGAAGARPLAQDYLRRYPRGAYARLAEEILRP